MKALIEVDKMKARDTLIQPADAIEFADSLRDMLGGCAEAELALERFGVRVVERVDGR